MENVNVNEGVNMRDERVNLFVTSSIYCKDKLSMNKVKTLKWMNDWQYWFPLPGKNKHEIRTNK